MTRKRSLNLILPIAALVLLATPAKSSAIPTCASQSVDPYRNESDISKLVENVVFIKKTSDPNEKDDRLTQEQYARQNGLTRDQAEAMFGATGKLKCGQREGSADVVVKRNLILTAAHIFSDPATCKPIAQPESCTFETVVNGQPLVRKIKGYAQSKGKDASGFKCPDHYPSPTDDWAILTLDQPVANKIEPYGIGDAGQMSVGENVLAVNGQNADFFAVDRNTGRNARPQTIAPCEWGEAGKYGSRAGLIATNCSGAGTSSGSALLNKNHQIVGIVVGGVESHAELAKSLEDYIAAVQAHKKDKTEPDPGPFRAHSCSYSQENPDLCDSSYNPIQGALKDVLDELSAGSGP